MNALQHMDATSDGKWQTLIDLLRGGEYQQGLITEDSPVHRIDFDDGLTDAEVESVETSLGFRFPPDLRAFLQTALPCGSNFPNWRSADLVALREWLDKPSKGILFDVEHNDFWLDIWGPRPIGLHDAVSVAADLLGGVPRLIPVFGHRIMPDEPCVPGNPVLSVHQTDIIRYGFDLTDYFQNEFNLAGRRPWPAQVRPIRFWDLIIS